ncbi:hypothetical protein [Methanolapillus millepedarum]|uniref:Uncharacterized protein n=1 Tax=Methanolapillus millepedarum TaxID=3028296 RepID=A0AA96V4Q0_9EURY|nr:hypothetical protein MsAc7_14500 [Methanosarcinaceae archaeon Ac7]
MKNQFITLLIIVLSVIFISGCLESKDPINPLGKNISEFQTSVCNIPSGEDLLFYRIYQSENDSKPGIIHSNETLMSNADLVFYGTVKEVRPSVWTTPDGKTPSQVLNASPELGVRTIGDENCVRNYRFVSVPGTNESIYTSVIFEADDWVKGPTMDEVVIEIQGGQVDRYVMLGSYVNPWDLKPGDKYLVYANFWDGNRSLIMPNGLFVVED